MHVGRDIIIGQINYGTNILENSTQQLKRIKSKNTDIKSSPSEKSKL